MKKQVLPIVIIVLTLCFSLNASANITLPSIIGSHMVLQQKSDVKLWGWCVAAEKIRVMVDWDSTIYTTTGNSGGRWSLTIKTPEAGGPYKIVINGNNAVVLDDVMIGEVWVCSGQSNMQWSGDQGLKQTFDEMPNATNTKIRFFYVTQSTSDYLQDDCRGHWVVCNPEDMKHFSAVGYFFGKKLQNDLNVPVGLINSNWGGTPAEVWTPKEVVENDATLSAAAKKINPFPWWPTDPAQTYNAMIFPLTNFAVAGAIWYQGESNVGTASTYEQLLTRMIDAWRKAWNRDLAFYLVQIAPFTYGNYNVGALLREAETKAANYHNTGMVVITDLVTDTTNIHPTNKIDVATRLANYALAQTYGKKGITYKSPVYKDMKVEGNKIRISFDNVDSGLVSKNGDPNSFMIAGYDKNFVPAQAKIDGNTVVVWSKDVPHPAAVRFAFTNTTIPNLFSKEGLPVNLFRTDNWEVNTDPVKK